MNQMLSVREFINLIADGKIEVGERFIFRGSVYTNDGKSIRNEQNIYLKNELFGRFGCADFTSENMNTRMLERIGVAPNEKN